MINLGDMFGKAFGGKAKMRRMTVSEAHAPLIAEEADKLLDNDAMIRDAIEVVENDGIVFIDEIDKICARTEFRGGGELFPMHAGLGDAGGGGAGDHRVDQRLGPAHIEMGVIGQPRAQRGEVELALQAVDVEAGVAGMRALRQVALEGAVLGGAEGVVQLVGGAARRGCCRLRARAAAPGTG